MSFAEMGHTARGCKEERVVHERVEVKCVNCSAVGHRARDCTEPRRDRFACRNCGYSLSLFKCMIMLLTVCRSSEHKASDCPNPRSAEGVECKRCNEGDTIQFKLTHPYMLICIFSRSFCEGLSAGPCPENVSQLRVCTNSTPLRPHFSFLLNFFRSWCVIISNRIDLRITLHETVTSPEIFQL